MSMIDSRRKPITDVVVGPDAALVRAAVAHLGQRRLDRARPTLARSRRADERIRSVRTHRPVSPVGSVQAAHRVGGRAVVGDARRRRYSWPRIRHQAGMSGRAAGSSASTVIVAPTATSPMCRARSRIGSGQRRPRQSSHERAHRPARAELGAHLGDHAGQHGAGTVDLGRRSSRGAARRGRCPTSARPSPPARATARASTRCTTSRTTPRSRAGPARSAAPRRRRTGRRT